MKAAKLEIRVLRQKAGGRRQEAEGRRKEEEGKRKKAGAIRSFFTNMRCSRGVRSRDRLNPPKNRYLFSDSSRESPKIGDSSSTSPIDLWTKSKISNLKSGDHEFLDGTRHVIYPWNESKIENRKSSSPRIYPWGRL